MRSKILTIYNIFLRLYILCDTNGQTFNADIEKFNKVT